MREHLKKVPNDPRNKPPMVSPVFTHLVDWFDELSNTRQHTMAGAQPITYLEIDAWARRTWRDPTGEEVKILRAMDDQFLSVIQTFD